ncbi:hypothetical protein RB195_019912 [Necator americanus]|uniref:Uncharacterized protein n=1 Tax=Necator americanus TaxID=51031 RepID=A0ABR1CGB6_NECAM
MFFCKCGAMILVCVSISFLSTDISDVQQGCWKSQRNCFPLEKCLSGNYEFVRILSKRYLWTTNNVPVKCKRPMCFRERNIWNCSTLTAILIDFALTYGGAPNLKDIKG